MRGIHVAYLLEGVCTRGGDTHNSAMGKETWGFFQTGSFILTTGWDQQWNPCNTNCSMGSLWSRSMLVVQGIKGSDPQAPPSARGRLAATSSDWGNNHHHITPVELIPNLLCWLVVLVYFRRMLQWYNGSNYCLSLGNVLLNHVTSKQGISPVGWEHRHGMGVALIRQGWGNLLKLGKDIGVNLHLLTGAVYLLHFHSDDFTSHVWQN